MKRFVLFLFGCTLLGSSAAVGVPQALVAAENETGSSCVACHTNVKKLIRLCWKIEAERPKSSKSSETSGEG